MVYVVLRVYVSILNFIFLIFQSLLIEIGVRKLTEKKKKRKLWVATFQPQKKLILMLMDLFWRDEFNKYSFDL